MLVGARPAQVGSISTRAVILPVYGAGQPWQNTALLDLRVQEAIRRGYRYLTINASEMSRPIVSKYGFELLANEYSYRYVEQQETAG